MAKEERGNLPELLRRVAKLEAMVAELKADNERFAKAFADLGKANAGTMRINKAFDGDVVAMIDRGDGPIPTRFDVRFRSGDIVDVSDWKHAARLADRSIIAPAPGAQHTPMIEFARRAGVVDDSANTLDDGTIVLQ